MRDYTYKIYTLRIHNLLLWRTLQSWRTRCLVDKNNSILQKQKLYRSGIYFLNNSLINLHLLQNYLNVDMPNAGCRHRNNNEARKYTIKNEIDYIHLHKKITIPSATFLNLQHNLCATIEVHFYLCIYDITAERYFHY